MTPRQHACAARALIAECGGLEEAAAAPGCGVSKSQLARYQDPQEPCTMTAQVMAALEAYCGAPVYSAALVAAATAGRTDGERLRDSGEEAVEAAAQFQKTIRTSLADGRLSPREKDALRSAGHAALRELHEAVSAIDGGGE